MRCPRLEELPPSEKSGWPWNEETPPLPARGPGGREWPKVSLVIPSLNQGMFIEESIRSVLLQGYPELELIIIDGGSKDDSVGIIKKYGSSIKYWVSEPDRGQSHAVNKGLLLSEGRYWNWQNADDVLTPGSLQRSVSAMEENPGFGMAYGYRTLMDRNSSVLEESESSSQSVKAFGSLLEECIVKLSGGTQPGCLMDRALVVSEGMVDENFHYVMDRELFVRLALKKPPLYVDYPLVAVRDHPECKSRLINARRAGERLAFARKIFKNREIAQSWGKLKKRSFASAHRFAWEIFGRGEMNGRALWHLLMDVASEPLIDWKARRKVAARLSQSGNSRVSRGVFRLLEKAIAQTGLVRGR